MAEEELKKVVREDQLEKLERSFNGSNKLTPSAPVSQASSSSTTKKDK